MADRLPMVEVPGQVPTVQVMTGQAPMVQAPMMELNRSYQTQQVPMMEVQTSQPFMVSTRTMIMGANPNMGTGVPQYGYGSPTPEAQPKKEKKSYLPSNPLKKKK